MGYGHRGSRPFRKEGHADRGLQPGIGQTGYGPSPIRGPISWFGILVGLAVWTVLAYVGYLALDFVLSWLAANSGTVLQGGKNAGDALGAGKEVGVALDRIKSTGLIDQGFNLLRSILAPVAFVIWALGAVAIFLLPRLLGLVRDGFGARRH